MRARSDSGQLVPLYALIVLVACGAALVLVHLGVITVHRAHARTAADAAALAGAAEGRAAAEQVAAANGAVLESFDSFGDEVEVRVRVGGSHAQWELFEETMVACYLRLGRHDDALRLMRRRLQRRASPRDVRWLDRARTPGDAPSGAS